jgi:hypothetical protein
VRRKPRRYLSLAGALVASLALADLAAAQSLPAGTPRIGLLAWSSCNAPPVLRGLEELGYKPGETVTIECRSGERSYGASPQRPPNSLRCRSM